jgi:hypothetical protein
MRTALCGHVFDSTHFCMLTQGVENGIHRQNRAIARLNIQLAGIHIGRCDRNYLGNLGRSSNSAIK